jgi:hypothetical protein
MQYATPSSLSEMIYVNDLGRVRCDLLERKVQANQSNLRDQLSKIGGI